MAPNPESQVPHGPARDGMLRHAGMVGGSVVSAGLSRLVAAGHRVFTPYGLFAELHASHPKATEASARATLHAWVDLGWLKPFVPPKGQRTCYALTAECPLVADATSVRLETVLALVGAHACYGYRTALALHGLSEEMLGDQVIVCRPRQMDPPAMAVPFSRSQRAPQAWAQWEGLKVLVSDRPATVISQDTVSMSRAGVLATTPLRTLLDCWARPGCGVSDDRLIAAWRSWLDGKGDDFDTSPTRKLYDCARMVRQDPDQRPGRLDAFLSFLMMVDEHAASSFMSEWSGLEDG